MIEYENLQLANRPYLEGFRNKFDDVLKKGWFILGSQVAAFERQFAAYCGAEYCVGVGNGMDALTIALKAYAFAPGSTVIVPSNTYIATVLAVMNSGLKPLLVEPDIRTYNLDPSRIEAAILPTTVAIIPVHLYGKSCQMDAISAIAAKHHLKVIEDCAQAHGAAFKNRKTGTWGDAGAFSFYPTKNLGALGDGGALVTSNQVLQAQFRLFRNYGAETKNEHQVAGMNSRLDELQAAFLQVKLASLEDINAHKRRLASVYQQGLRQDFIRPAEDPEYHDVFHIYNVRHEKRDKLRSFLLEHGIETAVHYPVPPYKQKALNGMFEEMSFPISDAIHATTLSLPLSTIHSAKDIEEVVKVMNKF